MATHRSIRNLTLAAALAFSAAALPLFQAHAAPVIISVNFAPPALPVYAQPVCPDEGYIWTPGYWGYDDQDGYYWVPGVWALPPEPGLLWTPGYWAWDDDTQAYVWDEGYWAPEVGFYGGVNYGFGYEGIGYDGGYWDGGFFFYNTRVSHIGGGFGHVYDRPVVFSNHTTVSFNGGRGGLTVHPSDHELAAIHDHHLPPTETQRSHQGFAGQNHDQFARFNNGRPPVPAAASANSFHDHPSDPGAAARPSSNDRNFNQPPSDNHRNGGTFSNPGSNNPPHPQPQQQPHPQPQQPQHPQTQTNSHPAPPPHDDRKPDTREPPR